MLGKGNPALYTAPLMNWLTQLTLSTRRRLALPIAVFPGAGLVGATVRDLVTDPQAQSAVAVALQERYATPAALTAMDLSVEAEAFGCEILWSEGEVPTVTGAVVTDLAAARALRVPEPGEGRTGVYLEAARRLANRPGRPPVLAGCIGPFSLAARLAGVSEALMLTATEPELMHTLLEKSARFLANYLQAFRAAGARGVIMAEPAAGLLSPAAMREFSSAYIRQIAETVGRNSEFAFVLHNCAARLVHLPAVRETGLDLFHFGAPMDLVAALGQVPPGVVLCGNLDPAAVFVQSTPEQVTAATEARLATTRPWRNFIVSSGCDVPARAPLANLDAFFATVNAVGTLD